MPAGGENVGGGVVPSGVKVSDIVPDDGASPTYAKYCAITVSAPIDNGGPPVPFDQDAWPLASRPTWAYVNPQMKYTKPLAGFPVFSRTVAVNVTGVP